MKIEIKHRVTGEVLWGDEGPTLLAVLQKAVELKRDLSGKFRVRKATIVAEKDLRELGLIGAEAPA